MLAEPDQILITCGSSDALGLLWRTFREHGARRIAVEDPSWPRIGETILQAGLDARARAGRRTRAGRLGAGGIGGRRRGGLSGASVSDRRGHASLPPRGADRLGSALGRLIVEDDYDAEYRYDGTPIASLQSMAPDHVAYIGTCSKTLAPGMRLGWLIVPDRLAVEQVHQHAITYAQPSALTQAGFVILLERGDLDRHLRRTRRIYRARRATLVTALAGGDAGAAGPRGVGGPARDGVAAARQR